MSGPWEDREYIGRYEGKSIGFKIYRNGVLTDADSSMFVSMVHSETGDEVFSNFMAGHEDEGIYTVLLNANDTDVPGPYDVTWSFTLDGVAQTAQTFVEVGKSTPEYDVLDDNAKGLVDNVWMRLADLFDSPFGGPNLTTYFQSHFDRGRIAQLARVGMNRLNTIAQPHMTYTIDGDKIFPYDKWGGILEQATYLEVIKHLIRSYGEQPNWPGVSIARADRQHYVNHWRSVLNDETADMKDMLDSFKIAHMGLGRPHVTVAGGVYGNYGPTRIAGQNAARPRYWARFYAILLILGIGLAPLAWQAGPGSQIHPPTSGVVSVSQQDQTGAG